MVRALLAGAVLAILFVVTLLRIRQHQFLFPRIEDSRGRRDENSGYARLFGNARLGQLLSRVHATVISSGNDLEARLEKASSEELKATLEMVRVRARRD